MLTPYLSSDGLRAIVVLILAVAQCVMAFWPDLRRWPQTTATRSKALDTPVVPVAQTFAIWGPIFAGCLTFAVWQALPGNLDHPMARQIGWLAALVFAANTVWEYVVPRFGMGWSSVGLAMVEFAGLGLVLMFLAWGSWGLGPVEWWIVAAPFHLFAGWVTAAVAVNLSSVLVAKGYAIGQGRSLALLFGAGSAALAMTWVTGAVIYAAAILWALGGVALAARGNAGRGPVLAASLALAAAVTLTAYAAPRPVQAASGLAAAQTPRETQVVHTADLAIHYLVWGPEDGQPVLAFHGWPDDAGAWTAVASRLAGQGYRVYAPYLRGFGQTAFRDPSALRTGQLAALVSDAFAFADALGLETYGLIGHDWGGRIVQAMAALQPERVDRLVSLSGYSISYAVAPPPPPRFVPQLWYQFALNLPVGRANLTEDPDGFLYAIWTRWTPGWATASRQAAYRSTWLSLQNPDFDAITLTAYSYIGRGYDPKLAELEARLAAGPQVLVPVVIIQGSDDPLERPEITSEFDDRMFPGGLARHILPDTGHWPHREAPDAVTRIYLGAAQPNKSQ